MTNRRFLRRFCLLLRPLLEGPRLGLLVSDPRLATIGTPGLATPLTRMVSSSRLDLQDGNLDSRIGTSLDHRDPHDGQRGSFFPSGPKYREIPDLSSPAYLSHGESGNVVVPALTPSHTARLLQWFSLGGLFSSCHPARSDIDRSNLGVVFYRGAPNTRAHLLTKRSSSHSCHPGRGQSLKRVGGIVHSIKSSFANILPVHAERLPGIEQSEEGLWEVIIGISRQPPRQDLVHLWPLSCLRS